MNAVDRELALDELIGVSMRARLERRINTLLGVPSSLSDQTGRLLWGAPTSVEDVQSVPVRLEIEPLGYLKVAGVPLNRLSAAAGVISMLMQQRAQYLMASDLHVEAIQADYETLLAKNAALEESEQRYRQLSAQLESRVQDQVALIEARQRQLYESERLASVGQLAAGVAHEINNPIGFVRSNLATSCHYVADLRKLYAAVQQHKSSQLQLLCEQLELDFVIDDFDELLRDSIDGADRIARIVSDLKGFSNVDGDSARKSTDLNEKLAIVCDMVAAQLPDGVFLHRSFATDSMQIVCSAGHLNQVFMNVLRNAVQAVGNHGTISVCSTRRLGNVVVTVSDDGPGIEPASLPHVFDPFFTTREVGGGTGLGLTVARDIINAHEGHLEIVSHPGAGCKVSITLPAEH